MDIKERFEQHGQGHVFQYWDSLDEKERAELLEQTSEIDVDELDKLIGTLSESEAANPGINYDALEPAPYERMPADVASDA